MPHGKTKQSVSSVLGRENGAISSRIKLKYLVFRILDDLFFQRLVLPDD
jgi:hypothetical protein